MDGHPAFQEVKEMASPENDKRSLRVLNDLVVDGLRHAPDCLDYLNLIKNRSAFNFCAIPQVMAIAQSAVYGSTDAPEEDQDQKS